MQVAVLSVDEEAATQALIDKHHLSFRAGHSANAHEVARLTGAFLNEDPLDVQSAGFILDPAGRVVVSVYSSGAIGRLVPEDIIGLVRAATRDCNFKGVTSGTEETSDDRRDDGRDPGAGGPAGD